MGGSVLPTAHSHNAGGRKRSCWEKARRSLVMPVGVIVAVAIICVVVGVLTSAHRADEVSLNHDQELLRTALTGKAVFVMRQLESATATPQATLHLHNLNDLQWADRRVGGWLQVFYKQDVVAIVDGRDQIAYSLLRAPQDADSFDLHAQLVPIVGLLRGRLTAVPAGAVPVVADQDPKKPGRSTALIQRFMGHPAIVAAVAIGSDADLAQGNGFVPIAISAKYLSKEVLQGVGQRLQLTGLHLRDGAATAADEADVTLAGVDGATIASFAWKPTRPGGTILGSVLPFIAIAIGGFALLVGLIMRYMRRAAEEIREGESQLRHLALHDPVCGLPNRIFFSERLENVINAVRAGGPTAAVFYIDLDHFKDVNDTLGHHIGDELILNVTQRLSRILRGDDLVARLGGDEFAIITTCASDSYSLQAIAGRIISAVCAPYMISGHNIIIGASIGIAVIDRRAHDSADILRYADMALYRAKNEGRNRACIYDAAMDADLSNRKLLEGDLLYAIKNDGLHAVYQPIVNASGDKIVGVEALARWNHPTIGAIPPSQFIPIAEHSGLIIDLGEWMLRRACIEGRAWPNLTVAVNVSPLQFRRSDFVEVVERILNETQFEASRLELELTESTLLGNLDTAELSMLRLKAIGVRFALDELGTRD